VGLASTGKAPPYHGARHKRSCTDLPKADGVGNRSVHSTRPKVRGKRLLRAFYLDFYVRESSHTAISHRKTSSSACQGLRPYLLPSSIVLLVEVRRNYSKGRPLDAGENLGACIINRIAGVTYTDACVAIWF
jgi:hypothetical protein